MTWLDLAPDDPFGVHNLPYCSFATGRAHHVVGVRVGDRVLDLSALESAGHVDAAGALEESPTLNHLLDLGPDGWAEVRQRLRDLLTQERHRSEIEDLLFNIEDVSLALPFDVGDYVDFYSSEHHASNVGRIFRPDQPPLLPNWRHLPVGYHGRSGTVTIGEMIDRPCGQHKTADADRPAFGPSTRLDIEAEVGFVVGVKGGRADGVTVADFPRRVFGVVLVNDWSARDIQAWEYQPLGPFLGKSFATSISPWVVPLAALEAARVPAPVQDPPVLDYLREAERYTFDIGLEVRWNGNVVSRPPFRGLYWTPAQQLAHMTVNGASLRSGDLYASGTVSGPERNQVGSFLELTWGGTQPVTLDDGSTRTFLEDGDTVIITATAPGPDGEVVGFGHVSGTIRPAR